MKVKKNQLPRIHKKFIGNRKGWTNYLKTLQIATVVFENALHDKMKKVVWGTPSAYTPPSFHQMKVM